MSVSQEKVAVDTLEAADSDRAASASNKEGAGSGAMINPDDFGFTPAEQKKILRHIDRRLVLTVGAMYCVSLMDRTNLSAANIAGMSKDLMLVGQRYVSVFLLWFNWLFWWVEVSWV